MGIVVLLIDFKRPKKSLADNQFKFTDLSIMILNNLFIAGIILITGAVQSPLISMVLIPIFTFAAEFGIKIGIWNFLGFGIFIAALSLTDGSLINFKNLINYLILINISTIFLITVSASRYFQDHFNKKVDRLLTRDELTGLYNRRFLKHSVSKQIKADKCFGFILIDINYFKYYNDYWGHSAGDNLLITIAKIFHKNARSHDIVVRHSGDEFIIMLPDSDQNTIKTVISKIMQSIESYNFPGEECFPDHKLSIAYGYTIFPGDARNYQELFTAADQALYQYKKERCQSWSNVKVSDFQGMGLNKFFARFNFISH